MRKTTVTVEEGVGDFLEEAADLSLIIRRPKNGKVELGFRFPPDGFRGLARAAGSLDEDPTLRRLQGRAGPRPVPPALLAGAGMVSPGQAAQGTPPFRARGRPEALAVTRRGPALPPPPPGKSPLTPLPPSSPPSCGASKTTEFGAGG